MAEHPITEDPHTHTEGWMLAAAHYISHCGMADPAAPNHTLSYNPNILFAYRVQRDFPIV